MGILASSTSFLHSALSLQSSPSSYPHIPQLLLIFLDPSLPWPSSWSPTYWPPFYNFSVNSVLFHPHCVFQPRCPTLYTPSYVSLCRAYLVDCSGRGLAVSPPLSSRKSWQTSIPLELVYMPTPVGQFVNNQCEGDVCCIPVSVLWWIWWSGSVVFSLIFLSYILPVAARA